MVEHRKILHDRNRLDVCSATRTGCTDGRLFDAIAGGGGLITLPVLFIAGVEPLAAIATNKFQAASATVSATCAFARKGMIDWRRGSPMAVMAFIGGALGPCR